MLKISPSITVLETEIEISFIRAAGPGGQNVNKVATAVQLRFDVVNSRGMADEVKQRLIKIAGQKITQEGVIVIKAYRYRTQERNRHDAIARLKNMILLASIIPKKRKPTKPTRASKEKRIASKKIRSRAKALRSKSFAKD